MDQTENKENMEAMEEEQIVVITDDEGNELYFREEMVVPVGKKNFAILAQHVPDRDGRHDVQD